MLKVEIGFDTIKCDNKIIGYSIDCMGKVERIFALLVFLKENQIESFNLIDGKKYIRVTSGATSFDTYTHTLCLEKNELSTLISMLSDVIQEKAFRGYHYDLECGTPNSIVDFTFLLS